MIFCHFYCMQNIKFYKIFKFFGTLQLNLKRGEKNNERSHMETYITYLKVP